VDAAVNYTLAPCGIDDHCSGHGVCASDGTCICDFEWGGTLCDAPANVTNTCTAFTGVSSVLGKGGV
jgi:hypothetical protein